MLCEKELGFGAMWARVHIPSLPHHLLCDLEQINLIVEAQFSHLKMKIIVCTQAVVRNKQGLVYLAHDGYVVLWLLAHGS